MANYGCEIKDAMEKLEILKAKVEDAMAMKDELTLEVVKQQDEKNNAEAAMNIALEEQERYRQTCKEATLAIEDEIRRHQTHIQTLKDKLKDSNQFLDYKRAEFDRKTKEIKLCAQIPDIKLKFSDVQKEDGDNDVSQHISGFFTVTQRPTILLTGGQALLTFEEKEVAYKIQKMAKCSVSCGQKTLDVRPKSLTLGPSVKFVIQLDVSKKELMFSGVQSNMPEEGVRDRLECSFSKPSRGGGEVERLEYDHNMGTGKVTFLNTGVVESLALIGKYTVDLDQQEIVEVAPVIQYHLEGFQTFCGAPERCVLLDKIKDIDAEDEMTDMLEIFFQKPSNSGGELEAIKYLSKGNELLALFDVIDMKLE